MSLHIEKQEKRIFKNTTVRLPVDVIEKVNALAGEKNLTFNKIMLYLVEYALKDVQ